MCWKTSTNGAGSAKDSQCGRSGGAQWQSARAAHGPSHLTKLPYAGINRIRFEGTISTAARCGTPTSAAIKPHRTRSRHVSAPVIASQHGTRASMRRHCMARPRIARVAPQQGADSRKTVVTPAR
ncbi:hypothetical protein XHC_3511 [Xanthomonas hortorum pv. carotae str. M081]|nr:hypothetical protein XHC_3511 [Xanthomonas hortorum pv. carotae str. M081]